VSGENCRSKDKRQEWKFERQERKSLVEKKEKWVRWADRVESLTADLERRFAGGSTVLYRADGRSAPRVGRASEPKRSPPSGVELAATEECTRSRAEGRTLPGGPTFFLKRNQKSDGEGPERRKTGLICEEQGGNVDLKSDRSKSYLSRKGSLKELVVRTTSAARWTGDRTVGTSVGPDSRGARGGAAPRVK